VTARRAERRHGGGQRRREGPNDGIPQAQRPRGGPNDDTNSPATVRRAQGRHSGSQHRREGPNDAANSAKGRTTTRRGSTSTPSRRTERRYHRPNDRVGGRTTTRTAQQQREGPKDDTAGVNTDAKGRTTTRRRSTPTRWAERRYHRPNDSTEGRTRSWGAQGGDSEQSRALLLFFLYVVFYLVHVPRHQGGTTPSLENKYIFFLVTFLQFLRYILNRVI